MQLSSKLLQSAIPWRGGAKNMVKCTVATDGRFAKLLNLYTQAKGSSDSTSFREMILNHGQESICIFDRGLQKRATFEEFIDKGIHFITRGNDNIRYQIVRIHGKVAGMQTGTLELMEDVVVRLGQKGSRFLSFEIRLIKAQNRQNGEVLTFLTNIYEMSAEEVCALYKRRWSIEVFFKFIKQELNTKHFLGHSKNTILVTLYMILIASVLLTEYRKRSEIKSYKFARRAFMNELRLEILKPVIEYCGGNPEKVYDYYLFHFP
ncbi:IS4 family transposase [Wolbachia endosymbiont of Folsomia candida]|uniref:IS4 family transposase n=1 Tax=Wolbachia endosymbiont of Folsomia candida TaxID=169402 RepID=UPI0030B825C8